MKKRILLGMMAVLTMATLMGCSNNKVSTGDKQLDKEIEQFRDEVEKEIAGNSKVEPVKKPVSGFSIDRMYKVTDDNGKLTYRFMFNGKCSGGCYFSVFGLKDGKSNKLNDKNHFYDDVVVKKWDNGVYFMIPEDMRFEYDEYSVGCKTHGLSAKIDAKEAISMTIKEYNESIFNEVAASLPKDSVTINDVKFEYDRVVVTPGKSEPFAIYVKATNVGTVPHTGIRAFKFATPTGLNFRGAGLADVGFNPRKTINPGESIDVKVSINGKIESGTPVIINVFMKDDTTNVDNPELTAEFITQINY